MRYLRSNLRISSLRMRVSRRGPNITCSPATYDILSLSGCCPNPDHDYRDLEIKDRLTSYEPHSTPSIRRLRFPRYCVGTFYFVITKSEPARLEWSSLVLTVAKRTRTAYATKNCSTHSSTRGGVRVRLPGAALTLSQKCSLSLSKSLSPKNSRRRRTRERVTWSAAPTLLTAPSPDPPAY